MKSVISKADLIVFRQLCEKRIEQIDPDRKAELALSGGTDSLTVLFSMLSTGRKPRCITFYVRGRLSSDLQASRNVCKAFGLELVEVELPTDPDQIISDIRSILPHCHKIKATIIQCMHPWLYMYPRIKSDLILNGLGGDDLYCTQRKVQVALHQKGEEAILSWRHVYSADLDFSSGNIHRYAAHFNKRNVDFYHCKEIEQWFLQFKAVSLNRPYEKYPSVAAFQDYYSRGKFRRLHSSYQINSGLKEAHERILQTRHNQRKAKAMIAIYNDLYGDSD
jgi:asparagine synthetase B (glutamine-hydrolysing)